MIRTLLTLICFSLVAAPALAEKKLLGTWEDWDAFEEGDGRSKACFMVSVPKKKSPSSLNHGTVYVTVAHKPGLKVKDEVSLITGYDFKSDSTVRAKSGGFAQRMFTVRDSAWNYDVNSDTKMVRAMKRGSNMTFAGKSGRGNNTTYTVSLIGFTAAYKAISDACN